MAYKPRIIPPMHRSAALGALLEAASEQGGYVTAAQATRLGLARDDIARLVVSDDLRRVRRGVFSMRHAQATNEDDIAAWLHFERDRLPWERRGATNAVISHASAAALHRLGTIIPELPTVTMISGAARTPPHVHGIDARRASLRDADWEWRDAGGVRLPITTPARTVIDLMLDKHEPSYVERAMAEALARGIATPQTILEAAHHRKSRPAALEQRAATLLEAAA